MKNTLKGFLLEFSYDQENWKPVFLPLKVFAELRYAETRLEIIRRSRAQGQHRKAFLRIVKFNS